MTDNILLTGGTDKNPLKDFLKNGYAKSQVGLFDYQFHLLQNESIRRMNKEITRIHATNDRQEEVATLKKKYEQYGKDVNGLKEFARLTDIYRNHMQKIYASTLYAQTSFSIEDKKGNLNLSDVGHDTYLRELKKMHRFDNLIAETDSYKYNIYDADASTAIHDLLTDLESYTPVVGPIDEPGTPPEKQTNDNRAIADKLSELSGYLKNTALPIFFQARVTANKSALLLQSKRIDLEKAVERIDTKRKNTIVSEVEMLKTRYANQLRSLDLRYEINANTYNQLSLSLEPYKPPNHSIASILI